LLVVFLDVAGICERIKSTPIPFSYNLFIKIFIAFYILIMPFLIIVEYGYLTIPAVMLVSYIMVGLELIGEEIEEPFGLERNSLPLTQLSNAIRVNVHEIFGYKLPSEEKNAAKLGFVIVT
jgi:ion channel-forming bestrophin family protein